VLDKLLANKPHERYQTAGEAAEALQALVKPKKSTAPPPSKKPAEEEHAHQAPPPAPVAPQPPPPPVIVTVRPEYPRWFAPLANLAEQKPTAALAALIAGAVVPLVVGFVLGWLLKR
jgi:serine/threonine-protein kinase